jgi:6-pyruvoyltetrahydropterin/6-carboxytetrahydropterin synthase
VVRTRVLDRFDHANLNLDPLFTSLVPTTENLCRAIFKLLAGALPTATLEYVRVEETENNFFQCYNAGPELDELIARESAVVS